MDLNSIASEICDQADDFLAGVSKRDEAKAGIAEWLTMNYPMLPASDKKTVNEQVMGILGNEGFFERSAGLED